MNINININNQLANDQLDEQIFNTFIKSSTCTRIEQCLAHPQEVKLYYYQMLY